jgi:cytochrome c553
MRIPALLALAALTAGAPAVALEGDAAAGQTKAAVCAACHGVDGNSTDPQYPKIAGQHASYTADQLARFKSQQRMNPIMLGFSITLSEQDMADLGAYFATQAVKPDIADEALLEKGQTLYRNGDARRGIPACMACHGPAGQGMPFAGYPSLSHQHAQYTTDMLKRFRAGEVHGPADDANAQVMAQVAKQLTDEEITALASYLQGLGPTAR